MINEIGEGNDIFIDISILDLLHRRRLYGRANVESKLDFVENTSKNLPYMATGGKSGRNGCFIPNLLFTSLKLAYCKFAVCGVGIGIIRKIVLCSTIRRFLLSENVKMVRDFSFKSLARIDYPDNFSRSNDCGNMNTKKCKSHN